VLGQHRTTALRISARVKKNKVGMPLREVEFRIRFGYGIEDLEACVDFLDSCKRISDLGIRKAEKTGLGPYYHATHGLPDAAYYAELDRVHAATTDVWYEIERKIEPVRRKYGRATAELA
jgi:hypothetical protein